MLYPNVKEALERRYQATMNNPNWIHGMVYLIQVSKKKEFRWHDSGDVQSLEHLLRIFQVCELTPEIKHLQDNIQSVRQTVVQHPLYNRVQSLEDIQKLMQHHVFAV